MGFRQHFSFWHSLETDTGRPVVQHGLNTADICLALCKSSDRGFGVESGDALYFGTKLFFEVMSVLRLF